MAKSENQSKVERKKEVDVFVKDENKVEKVLQKGWYPRVLWASKNESKVVKKELGASVKEENKVDREFVQGLGRTSENQSKVVKKELDVSVKEENKVERVFERDFGSRLRLEKGAILIREIGHKLHCTLITVTKAMVLFHKVKRNPKFNTSCLTSVACLNLSIKLCDEAVTPDEIVLKSYHVIMDFENTPNPARPDPTSEVLHDMKKNLCLAEYAISRSMSFKLECTLAHIYVYKFLEYVKQSVSDVSDHHMAVMSNSVTKLLSTYYLSESCIDFAPDEIAWAALKFIYLFFGISLTSMKEVFQREIAATPNKSLVDDILDELVMISDVSTSLKNI